MKTSKLVVDEVPIEEWHCQSLSGMLGGYTGVYHFTSQNKPLFHKFNSSIATRLLTVDLTHAMAKRIPWIYIFIWYPPPPRPILSQNLLVFALFCCFLLCLNVCFFWRLFYMFKKLCRVVKTLPPLIKLFSFNRKGFLQNLEKTKKPKKPKLLQKVLVFWFFGFLEVSFGFKNLNQKKQKNSRKTKKNNLLT